MNWLTLLLFVHLAGVSLWIGSMAFLLLVLQPSLVPLTQAEQQGIQANALGRFFAYGIVIMPLALGSGWAIALLADGRPALWTWSVNAMQTAGIAMGGLFLLMQFGPYAFLRDALDARDATEAAVQLDRIRRLLAISLALGVLALASAVQGH